MGLICLASNIRPSCCSPLCKLAVDTLRRGASASLSTQVTSEAQESPSIRRKRSFAPRKRIFSGIQPTGIPHLGNYLGALRRWRELQDEKFSAKKPKNHQLLFAIADLHALTAQQDPALFKQQRLESFASLLAIGLDPKQSILFMQSSVSSHAELMWILSTIASTGYLSRMTQWKSKLGLADTASIQDDVATQKLKLGLFSYPVLQAADILLYRPDFVPVGEDQAQHVEFTRTMARSFNAHYCPKDRPFFNPPTLVLSPAKRIMSLKEPTSKMSKSHQDPMSRVLITDTKEEIHNKIRGALTDSIEGISYDPTNRPGVSNLIEILKHTSHPELTCEQIAADNAQTDMRSFKDLVATSITKELEGIRERFHELINPQNPTLYDAMVLGHTRASSIASPTMQEIKQLLGLDIRVVRPARSQRKPGEADPQDLKNKVEKEQVEAENTATVEPDVLPQKNEGVDQPIAS